MKWRPLMSRLLAGGRHDDSPPDEDQLLAQERQASYALYRKQGRVDIIRKESEFDIYKGKRS